MNRYCWLLITIIQIALLASFLYYIAQLKEYEDVEDWSSYEKLFLTAQNIHLIESKTFGILIDKIIDCESDGDPTARNPTSTAYGLCQFIDGTWEYCQNKWEIELDRDSPKDQLYACERLLREEGLDKHWAAISECLKKYEK